MSNLAAMMENNENLARPIIVINEAGGILKQTRAQWDKSMQEINYKSQFLNSYQVFWFVWFV